MLRISSVLFDYVLRKFIKISGKQDFPSWALKLSITIERCLNLKANRMYQLLSARRIFCYDLHSRTYAFMQATNCSADPAQAQMSQVQTIFTAIRQDLN